MASNCDPFTVRISIPPAEMLARLRVEASKHPYGSVQFDGDERQGTGSARRGIWTVELAYTVSGQDVTITFTSKPYMLACRMIEREVRKFLTDLEQGG